MYARIKEWDHFNLMNESTHERVDYKQTVGKIGKIVREEEPRGDLSERSYYVLFEDHDESLFFFDEEIEKISDLEYKIMKYLGEIDGST